MRRNILFNEQVERCRALNRKGLGGAKNNEMTIATLPPTTLNVGTPVQVEEHRILKVHFAEIVHLRYFASV
jgi:hypothetical protein